MTKLPSVKLNTGASMPAIGFGTWALTDGPEAKKAIQTALSLGYRLIDTAKLYGNEASVGEAIADSVLPREEIFVTTKLWVQDMGYESTHQAFEDSRRTLNLSYIDLYLIHSPANELRHDSWRAMVEIYQKGGAKAVGVSNYNVHHLEEQLERSSLIPAVNQIKFNPFVYKAQAPTLDFCAAHGIVVEAYTPLARAQEMEHPVIAAIAKECAKTPAQIMLRWAIQHTTVPIPKSSDPGRMKENLHVFDFELSAEQMKKLNNLSN